MAAEHPSAARVPPWPTRRLTATDWTDAVALAHAVGWKDSVADWDALASVGTALGLRDPQGVLRATGVLCRFDGLVSVAKMLVHPQSRGLGLAGRLLTEVLALAPGDCVATLIATEQGYPVYLRYGFREVERLTVCTGSAAPGTLRGATVLDNEWQSSAADLDARAVGTPRRGLVADRWARAEAQVGVVRDGVLRAFGLRLAQGAGYILAPLVAEAPDDALAVLHALLPGDDRRGRIDVPARHPALLAEVQRLGFTESAPRQEMTLGGVPLPGARHLRFAPLALAYG